MNHFNETVDDVLFKPVATVYNTILPKPVIRCIGNFFANIDMVPTTLNDVLQGNIPQAYSDFWRLLINSTAGIVGFI